MSLRRLFDPARLRVAFGVGVLLGAVGAGFLVFGEFGGWYYDGRGGYRTSVYDVSNDEYDPVWRETGSESWDSDGLLTEPALLVPVGIAAGALAAATVVMARTALRPGTASRRGVAWAGALAVVAAVAITVGAVLYAASMDPGDEWWFGSAFWAGLVNATLLAALAFGALVAMRPGRLARSPSDGS